MMDQDTIERLQQLFMIGEFNPISLRALPSKGVGALNETFTAADFPLVNDRWKAFATRAEKLNCDGYNIYTCLNPIACDFIRGAVCDKDIAQRRLLLIDLDRVGTHLAPATNKEIDAAHTLADKIERWFLGIGESRPTRVMSGNGVHLYYHLADLPNDDETHILLRSYLKSLAQNFNTDCVAVDTVVHNASRITKVPGTIARKGIESDERPYRKACFV
jgi:hypothetical protein